MAHIYWWAGLIIGSALTLLVLWLRKKGIVLKWYEWLMGVIAVLSIVFALQHLYTSIVIEYRPESAWILSGALLGLALVLGAAIFRLVQIIFRIAWGAPSPPGYAPLLG